MSGNLVIPIYYDIETTGLERDAEILQISGTYLRRLRINGRIQWKQYDFNRYMMPRKDISREAFQVHGIRRVYDSLFKNDQMVRQKNVGIIISV